MDKSYKHLDQFYPYYLAEHTNRTNRRLHFVGTLLALLQFLRCILISFNLVTLISVPVIGYGCSWVGHFFFEKNKPASFKYPWLSLKGDLRLFYEIATGARAF